MKPIDRRSFMRIAGVSLGFGALYHVLPMTASGETLDILDHMGKNTGERIKPFTFFQLSDTHVGFTGAPNPTGTKAFERAVEVLNTLAAPPDLVIFTGDLSHDSEDKDVHAGRMKQFKEIAGNIKTKNLRYVPGEHDAGLDEGILYREHFGETSYSFDMNGVHFVALDNVSRAKPEVGAEFAQAEFHVFQRYRVNLCVLCIDMDLFQSKVREWLVFVERVWFLVRDFFGIGEGEHQRTGGVMMHVSFGVVIVAMDVSVENGHILKGIEDIHHVIAIAGEPLPVRLEVEQRPVSEHDDRSELVETGEL